ncbi:hypothetical protein CAOG_009702 [Capsaspora owczarzaki ATCC 30864]|uniref:Uncharacterized protein n=1 Tax=Capsaspora owczarzaki (strain ATCC 30864) TaxID=595528 RepID=A0A0D2UCL9_CAPO3|nr:hypothetical protein CAOG_009702 [Capsaspora owczarzaki ATCC 30864]
MSKLVALHCAIRSQRCSVLGSCQRSANGSDFVAVSMPMTAAPGREWCACARGHCRDRRRDRGDLDGDFGCGDGDRQHGRSLARKRGKQNVHRLLVPRQRRRPSRR